MRYGSTDTGELERAIIPLPADLIEQPGETPAWQLSSPEPPKSNGHAAFAALALAGSLANIAGGTHIPGTDLEGQSPWNSNTTTTSLVVESGGVASYPTADADHSNAAVQRHLTTVRIHEGQTLWGIESDEQLPRGTLVELNHNLIPTAIPANSPVKTISTGAVHEIATKHHETPEAAAFEITISAEGGRTWHNGPKAELPTKGDGVLLHEAGSGYFSGVIESMHADSSGRHFAKVYIVELNESVFVSTADTQRIVAFGSFTSAPDLAIHAGDTFPTVPSASGRTAVSATVHHVPKPRDDRMPSARPSASVPAVYSPTNAQGNTGSTVGSGSAVTPDLGAMLTHPAKLASTETTSSDVAAAQIVLDAFSDPPDATPSPAASANNTASLPTSPGEVSPSSTATGVATGAVATSSAVVPNLSFLQNGPTTSKDEAQIPGAYGYQAPSSEATPGTTSSTARTYHERAPLSERSIGQTIAHRARLFANSPSAYYQAWQEEAVRQGYATQSWAENLNGVSCDELTSSAVETIDPQFPMFDVGVQYHYMMRSPNWEVVHISDPTQLQAGDVLNWGLGDESGGAAGHTAIALGDGYIVAASLGGHGPLIEQAYLTDPSGRGLTVFRYLTHSQPPSQGTPSTRPAQSAGSTTLGSLANIPGAVSPSLGLFAVFNQHPAASTSSSGNSRAQQPNIPGAVSPNLGWLDSQAAQGSNPGDSQLQQETGPSRGGHFVDGRYESGETGPFTVEMFNRHLLIALALYKNVPIDQVLTREHMYALAAWEGVERGDLAWDNYGYFNLLNTGLNDPSLVSGQWNGSGLEAFKSMDDGIQALLYVFTGSGTAAPYQTRMTDVLTRPSSAEEVLTTAAEFWKTNGNLAWAAGNTPNDPQSVVTFNEDTYLPDLLHQLQLLRAGGYHSLAQTQIGFGQHGQNVVSSYHVQY